ncbi:MAG: hypothetical protein BAJALOKI1v1_1150006 [Promethearchaeota archaeon]|nr:MAG: hypothetical protein BAJALOKI1v1_1150006 [Candidatus Lokiarchaeota archaeon]
MLKKFVDEIFDQYGLNEEELEVYKVYCRVPRATLGEVYLYFKYGKKSEIKYENIITITEKLVEAGFLKEIDGIVKRYIPLEPYFELYTSQSAVFRKALAKIQDQTTKDKSSQFNTLNEIQDKSIEEFTNSLNSQTKIFMKETDMKNQNKEKRITKASERFTTTGETFQKDLHEIMDTLNTDLKSISGSFKEQNENKIKSSKDDIERLISELLGDFSNRVDDLELELKKELDEHYERHKTTAGELHPKMNLILEKYFERMDKIVVDLKNKISNLLYNHTNNLKNTTENLKNSLKSTFDEKHDTIVQEVTKFKDNTTQLIENLLEYSDLYTDLSKTLSSRFAAFKALFSAKHEEYKERYQQVKEQILEYSKPLKDDFIKTSDEFIQINKETTDRIKLELTGIITSENDSLATETADLNQKAERTIDIQLEHLASELATEIEKTLNQGVKDCSTTTVKLRDLIEKTVSEHNEQYSQAINLHKDDILRHYTDYNQDVQQKNDSWVLNIDNKFNNSKNSITDKIGGHITSWEEEATELNENLTALLQNHATNCEESSKTLQESLSNTSKNTTQKVKNTVNDWVSKFQNYLHDATEVAQTTEQKLMNIFKASNQIPEISEVSTWHTQGRENLISAMNDAISRAKSSIMIITPITVPEILQEISLKVADDKSIGIIIICHWDMTKFKEEMRKLRGGNVTFRHLPKEGRFYAISRDEEEIILCPNAEKEQELISVISNQKDYAQIFSQFIYSIYKNRSRPIQQ